MDHEVLAVKLKEIEAKKESLICEAVKELEKIDDKKYSELKKQISSFYKWYNHPSLGNEWLGGSDAIFFVDAIFLLHLIPDNGKYTYLIKKGKPSKPNFSIYGLDEDDEEKLKKRYGNYYEFASGDDELCLINEKGIIWLDWDSEKTTNAYSFAKKWYTKSGKKIPSKSDVYKVCRKYNMVKEAKLFGISLVPDNIN